MRTFTTLSRAIGVLMFLLIIAPWALAENGNRQTVTLEPSPQGFVSPMVLRSDPFNAVVVKVEQATEGLMINFDPGKGDWEEVEVDHNDGWTAQGAEALVFSSPAKQLQFKWADPDPSAKHLKVELEFLYEKTDSKMTLLPSQDQFAGEITYKTPSIISRATWGADENFRLWKPDPNAQADDDDDAPAYDPCQEIEEKYSHQMGIASTVTHLSGEPLTWPEQTMKYVNGFGVHHSDSEVRDVNGDGKIDWMDYRAIVKAIYSYHAKSRGWGDIGYNYLIDPDGQIYEGRAGGEKSIGAHALCFNNGTIGIALIGNFQENSITPAAQASLEWLLASRAKKYGVNVAGKISKNGKSLYSVFGHKDVRATACPGEKLYSKLPEIRKNAATLAKSMGATTAENATVKYDGAPLSQIASLSLKPGEEKTFAVEFVNKGSATWKNDDNQSTWLHVTGNRIKTFPGLKLLSPAKTVFMAGKLVEKEVPPGKKGTFMVTASAGIKAEERTFDLTVVADGRYKIAKTTTPLTLKVAEPKLSYSVVKTDLPKGKVFQGQRLDDKEYYVLLKNTGNTVWQQATTFIKASQPNFRRSPFAADAKSPTVLGRMVEAAVSPGEVGRFKLNLKAPANQLGQMKEKFTLTVGNRWLTQKPDMSFEVEVQKPARRVEIEAGGSSLTMKPGQKKTLSLTVKNAGNVSLSSEDFFVSLVGVGITTSQRRLALAESLAPGQTATLSFEATAPQREGTFRLVARGSLGHRIVMGGLLNIPVQVSGTPAPTSASPTDSDSAVSEDLFRVRLSYQSDTAELTASTSFKVANEKGQTLFSVPKEGVVSTQKTANGIAASYAGQTKSATAIRFVPTSGGIVEIRSWNRKPTWDSTGKLNDNKFRGTVELRTVDGEVAYINELPLEQYLWGLAEVSNSAHPEKMKTIAVLARSYAGFYMEEGNRKFPGKPYDGSDDPDIFQKYLGYGYESRSPEFVAAAKATSDEVVTYKNVMIKPPYFSKSSGKTKSAQEVWGWTDTPYLKSVADPWCEGQTPAGHQVGLSGCGADGQAAEGKTYEEIIKYYYQGVEVEKVG